MKVTVITGQDHGALYPGVEGEIAVENERMFRAAQPDDFIPVKFKGLTHPNPSEYKRKYDPIIAVKRKDLKHVE